MELRQLTEYAADMTDWWDFVSRYMALRKVNGAQVAESAGFNKSQVTQWSQGAKVTPKLARDTAIALNAPVLDAFVAAGYLQPQDTTAEIIERPVSALGDEELIAEVRRRMKGQRNAAHQTAPAGTSGQANEDEEALRRANKLKNRPGVIASIKPSEEPTVHRAEDG